jgi:hypothetical protein
MTPRVLEAESQIRNSVYQAYQAGREVERAAIMTWLTWLCGVVESISEQDGLLRLRDGIERCEHIREGETE